MVLAEFKDRLEIFFNSVPDSFNIAIQVPDSYVSDTLYIHDWLSKEYPSKFFFVVSDTSFNDCCVDHISAKHLGADAIIHFGPFCTLNYPIPVCFLPDLKCLKLNQASIYTNVSEFMKRSISKNILVILDQVEIPRSFFEDLLSNKCSTIRFAERGEIFDKNYVKLFEFFIPFDLNEFNDTSIIYIGPHERLSLDFGCIFYNNECLRIDSKTFSLFENSVSRELAKQSRLIDSIACFDHVGIIIENPNVDLHVQTAQCLQNICSANDIIADIIYVGRPNEMKLGNFADIEFFIHISCSGRPSFSFVKPIVSPFQFLCAKFELNFWENQSLRDHELLLDYCNKHKYELLQTTDSEASLGGQLVLKSFFELSTQLTNTRKNYSYHGLEINSANQEIKLHKGAVGNSTGYDYESKQ